MKSNKNNELHDKIARALDLLKHGETDAAKQVITDSPLDQTGDPASLIKLGEISSKLGLHSQALGYISRASELKPNNAAYIYALAEEQLQGCTHDDEYRIARSSCMTLLRKAIATDNKYLEPYIKLAKLEIDLNNFDAAIKLLEKAHSLKPGDLNILFDLTYALRQINRHDDALGYTKKMIRIQPDISEPYQTQGRILIELGKTEQAMASLEKAIKINKTAGPAYLDLSSIKKFTPDDYPLIQSIENNLQLGMSAQQRSLIHFSLGKMYDDCKKPDEAFEHYRKGNLLSKTSTDPQAEQKLFKKIKKSYTKNIIEKMKGTGSSSDIPVFVIGMPRSGSTLIEQIISSHPDGAGAGELLEIDKIDNSLVARDRPNDYTTELNKNLSAENIRKYAANYLEALQRNRMEARRIVDKMPDNFLHLGLINVLFPNATIIHSIRNPLDTCLSCYFQAFLFHPWSCDLKWIANRYRFYRKAMDHWKNILPEGKIIDAHYEQLVEHTDTRTRELIAHCGLEWSDKCLEFYKEKRAINTASMWQARQPIYSSSRKRWHRYAKHLAGLAQDLAEYLLDEDIAELADKGIAIKKKPVWIWW
ncbi:MAG: sulfotransferase [Gammaproteobacteria bacterium]|nr:sulfotransferase [Gammaproteobacteria bacterium]